MTNRQTDHLRLKGKPLSFKSKTKGTVDITIRNELEFEAFCTKGMFQRQHMSSILAQSFDPLFNLTSIFTCVARLVQREILSQEGGVMSMSQKVNVKHYRVLYKLVKLYFAIQYLELPRYLLVR